jgi:hypothetical protein
VSNDRAERMTSSPAEVEDAVDVPQRRKPRAMIGARGAAVS